MKSYTESYIDVSRRESGNLYLRLPSAVLARMDEAMQCRPIQTREDFAVLAILWALENLDADENIIRMDLQEDDDYPASFAS